MGTLALLLACSGLPPAAAAAAGGGSLLSGYGGPGEGSQAILGSTLLNGPKGGGGAGGRGAAPSAGGGGGAGASEGAAPAPATSTGSAPRSLHIHARPNHSRGGATVVEARTGRLPAVASAPGTSVGSQPLGLSAGDLLFILLALASLGLTGLLTTRLARQRT